MNSNLFGTTIGILILSIIYSFFLNIIFRKKDRVDTPSTDSFQKLIFINLIGIILELTRVLMYKQFGVDNNITIVFYRLFILYDGIFPLLFLYYIYTFSTSEENYYKKKKKTNLIVYIIILFMAILAFVLPIEINVNKGIASYGLVTSTFYVLNFTYILIAIILMIDSLYRKVSDFKHYIGFIILVFGEGLVFYIQSKNPYLSSISVMECVALLTMYFTVENTDKKIIEKLESAKNEAEMANKEKSNFLSSMSHEIRTPLNAIVGFSQDIQDRKDISEEVRSDANYIIEASNTLLEIVGNILDINKIESSELEIISQPYEYKKEIETLARINAVRIGDKPIKFNLVLDSNIPDVLIGDIAHIKEIITNIVSNAIKYTETGEIDLKTTIEFKDDNKCVLIIICEDTGKGISKENIEKLFDKFERLEEEKNDVVDGKGLGLSITKNLVEMMNGSIKVESEEGKGTKFIVQIPQEIMNADNLVEKVISINEKNDNEITNNTEIVKEDATNKNVESNTNLNKSIEEKKETDQPLESNDNETLEVKNVMVVDDNKMNVKVAERTLTNLGITVKGYLSGQECIDGIKNGEKYDLILMDIMMPEMSGTQTLEKLKELDNFNTPVIAFTADVVAGSEEKYLSQGFCYYLPKPFNKEQLKEALESINKES